MSKKRILDRQEIEQVMNSAPACFLAINTNNAPYIIPMNFGYADNALYLHTGLQGKKLELLNRDNRVGFCLTGDVRLVSGELACNWTVTGQSVTGHGRATLISDNDEKQRGLDIIMRHYTAGPYHYNPKSVAAALIIRIDIEEISGKSIA